MPRKTQPTYSILSEEVKLRIEQGLETWSSNPVIQKRFSDEIKKHDKALRHMEDSIIASEQLTEEDFTLRINVR